MIRRHNTALRLAFLAADALSAFALFIVISMVRFGADWAATWASTRKPHSTTIRAGRSRY